MDLNSTSCTSDDLVFRVSCDRCQCGAGGFEDGWNIGILFHDYNQGLSGYTGVSGWERARVWVWVWVWARVGLGVDMGYPLTITPTLVGSGLGLL